MTVLAVVVGVATTAGFGDCGFGNSGTGCRAGFAVVGIKVAGPFF